MKFKGCGFPSPPITNSMILHRLFEVTSCVPTGKWSYLWFLPHRAAGKTPRDSADCSEQRLQCRQVPERRSWAWSPFPRLPHTRCATLDKFLKLCALVSSSVNAGDGSAATAGRLSDVLLYAEHSGLGTVPSTSLALSLGCCGFRCCDSSSPADPPLEEQGPSSRQSEPRAARLYRACLAYTELPLGDALCP